MISGSQKPLIKYATAVICLAVLLTAAVQAKTKVACVGNSITERDPEGLGYVKRLVTMLGNGYEVGNFGKSSRTLLKKGDYSFWETQKFKDVFTFKPNIITIMLGANDSKSGNWKHSREFPDDLQAMVDTFHTITPKPQILLVLPPHAGEGKSGIWGSVILKEINPKILSVAEKNQLDVIDVNTPTQARLSLFPDGIHPDAAGYKLLADIFHEGILNYAAGRQPREHLLWYGDAPGAKGDSGADKPALYAHPAPDSNANGAAVIICPGGGYEHLSIERDGHKVAAWLNDNGISAFVLRYRYGPYRHPIPIGDARRAMRLVRFYASRYNIDTTRIGIMGFSAGGHLASTLLTHYDAGDSKNADPLEHFKSRPDFGILVYPVITLGTDTHMGTRDQLLGTNPSQTLIDSLSNHLHVTSQTPMTFLTHAEDDQTVPLVNSELFHAALRAKGVESELHIEKGGDHGTGLKGHWTPVCLNWLKQRGILDKKAGMAKPMAGFNPNPSFRRVLTGGLSGNSGLFPFNAMLLVIESNHQGNSSGARLVVDSKGRKLNFKFGPVIKRK